MDKFQKITKKIIEFRDKRDWKQFHNPKDLALSLNLEASEVLEIFQWRNEDKVREYVKKNKKEIGNELADVLYWVLLMSHDLDINIVEAIENKMEENKRKYPIEKAKGKSNKYTDL